MAQSYKTRRRLSLLLLLVGLPFYIVAALLIVNLFDRPPFVVELAIYLSLGVIWALPFKAVFKGIGQVDPGGPDPGGPDPGGADPGGADPGGPEHDAPDRKE